MASTLKNLDASARSGIDQDSITGLSLVELYASNNTKIKNVSYMARSLKILKADNECGNL